MAFGDVSQECLSWPGEVAGGTQEQLPVVVEFAGDHGAGDVQSLVWVVVGADLRDTQMRVPGQRAVDAGEEFAVAGDPGDVAAIGGTPVHEVVGDGGAVEDHDVVEADQRQQVPAGPVGVVDTQRVDVEVQAGSGGGDVEGFQQFSHGLVVGVAGTTRPAGGGSRACSQDAVSTSCSAGR